MHVPEISICICTFHRPGGLAKLLQSLQRLDPATPPYEVIVVDNDAQRSAQSVVQQAGGTAFDIRYVVEPIQSIARARTQSVRAARGNWIAFIDDDEEADPLWLVELWKQTQAGEVDAVFGTVVHLFESGAPEWIRSLYPTNERVTGQIVQEWDAATNNALVRRSAMLALGDLFSPDYGLTGGEDSELFHRMAQRGCCFVGSDAAITYELVPASRVTMLYLLRWWLTAGAATCRIHYSNISLWQFRKSLARKAGLTIRYLAAGIAVLPITPRQGLRYLLRAAFEGGILFSKLTGKQLRRYRIRRGTAPVEAAGPACLSHADASTSAFSTDQLQEVEACESVSTERRD